MASLVVVHGTGVRGPAYEETLQVVARKLHLARPYVTAVKCLWGDKCGVNLPEKPLSIPSDSDRGAGRTVADLTLEFWAQLYEDPLAELRQLAQRPGGGEWDMAELLSTFRSAAPNARLTESLQKLNMNAAWQTTRQNITETDVFKNSVARAPDSTLELRQALARAIAAQLTATALTLSKPVPDDQIRDEWIAQMVEIFRPGGELDPPAGTDDRSLKEIKQSILGSLSYGAQWLTAGMAERKRLAEASLIAPVAGDIVLYQSPRGDAIRTWVADAIRGAPKPRYVLAHSLGSVAAVDVLIQNKDLEVEHLITIGSPAPLFFEMNALIALDRESKLPGHFPRWLNIFDPRDLISYFAKRAFHDDDRIQDKPHESGQPLLYAHSAYWASDRAWAHVWDVIPAIPKA